MTTSVLWLLLAAGMLTFVTTFPLRSLLRAVGLIDAPDEHRKLHANTIPVGGGLAVFLGMTVGLIGLLAWLRTPLFDAVDAGRLPTPEYGAKDFSWVRYFLATSALMTALGLIDDRFELRGRQKLFGQIVISAATAFFCDLDIGGVTVFGTQLDFGNLGLLFAVAWLVGAINAVNLLDGADGMASIVGITIGLGLAGLAIASGRPLDAILPAMLAVCLIGFLPHNFPPAKVFLGDTGSQLIGLTLGVAAIKASLKGPATIAATAVIAIWAIPLFDIGVAIVRRKLSGRSIYMTDRGHLHHRLTARGLGGRRLLAAVGGMCAITAAGGVFAVYMQTELLAMGSVAIVLMFLVAKRLFGHSEAKLLANKTHSLAASLVPRSILPGRAVRVAAGPAVDEPRLPSGGVEELHELQGARDWRTLWRRLQVYAGRFDLVGMRLEVHVPSLNEDFVAHWKREKVTEPSRLWRVDFPLATERGVVGRLAVQGLSAEGDLTSRIAKQVDGLKLFEFVVMTLICEQLGWDLPRRPDVDPEWVDDVLMDEFFAPEGRQRFCLRTGDSESPVRV